MADADARLLLQSPASGDGRAGVTCPLDRPLDDVRPFADGETSGDRGTVPAAAARRPRPDRDTRPPLPLPPPPLPPPLLPTVSELGLVVALKLAAAPWEGLSDVLGVPGGVLDGELSGEARCSNPLRPWAMRWSLSCTASACTILSYGGDSGRDVGWRGDERDEDSSGDVMTELSGERVDTRSVLPRGLPPSCGC